MIAYLFIDGVSGPVKTPQFANSFECTSFGGVGPKSINTAIIATAGRPAIVKLCATGQIVDKIILMILSEVSGGSADVYNWHGVIIQRLNISADTYDDYYINALYMNFSFSSQTKSLQTATQLPALPIPNVPLVSPLSVGAKSQLSNSRVTSISRLRGIYPA